MRRVAGVDGYGRGAWVSVVLVDGRFAQCHVGSTLDALLVKLGRTDATAIDIPIGLPDRGPRKADRLARERVGGRWPSVFMTPPRRLLMARDFAEANKMAHGMGEKGISRQAFAIGPRIFETEHAIKAGAVLHEVHPEVSFAAISAGPLGWSKQTWRGAHFRRSLLEGVGITLPDDLGEANVVPVDDILDAAAAAWSADRIATGRHERLPEPPEVFSGGLPAAIEV